MQTTVTKRRGRPPGKRFIEPENLTTMAVSKDIAAAVRAYGHQTGKSVTASVLDLIVTGLVHEYVLTKRSQGKPLKLQIDQIREKILADIVSDQGLNDSDFGG